MADVSMRQMLEAGVHFGHQTRLIGRASGVNEVFEVRGTEQSKPIALIQLINKANFKRIENNSTHLII